MSVDSAHAPPPPPPALDALASASFCRVADARPSAGNRVHLLTDGAENYPRWLEAIAGARQLVLLENYMWRDDALGRRFADAMAAAAGRGVRCRVLVDWLGCRGRSGAAFWRRLRAAGVEVRIFNPPQASNPLQWISRDHRKLLCVDDGVAFAGGLCIGQAWLGRPERGIAAWRDTALEIRGPAVATLARCFADSWGCCGAPLAAADQPAAAAAAGDVALWVIAGEPDSMGLYRLEQLVAEIVEQSLWLADAYFVATTGYVRALTAAAAGGVDVRLLVPRSSNLKLVQMISRSAYRPLLEAGVRVFEWNGPMMHAKTAVADGRWCRVGSSNSNLASWISNRELDVTLHNEGLAAQMQEQYLRDLTNASEVLLQAGRVTVQGAAPPARGAAAGSAGRLLASALGLGSAVGASLARHRLVGASELVINAAAGLLLLGVAAVALLLPRLVATPLALAGAWAGVTLLLRARSLGRPPPPPP